ncbi:MAG: VCBS repeat-containing protein [Balneolaceae bacterium]|nr:MAG: VCBS repeat-containing protein [Balneolaceae bacterium]
MQVAGEPGRFSIPEPQFEVQVIDDRVSIGYGLAIGDVNGNGRPDILLADKNQIVWYRNGDWQRFVIAENLTEFDNVCIAARDITGDGQVEVAVGAQWNPGETSDQERSGSVHYLIRPDDPTELWDVVTLPHEPTVHRMRWVRTEQGRYSLVVVPLHGRGNVGGEGEGVQVLAYLPPENPRDPWEMILLDASLNMTHNFDVISHEGDSGEFIFIGGRQGVVTIQPYDGKWVSETAQSLRGVDRGIGEIRHGTLGGIDFLTTIEPMHGNEVAVYLLGDEPERHQLDDSLHQGHALAAADLLGLGIDQIVAGWRNPDPEGKVGIKLYVPLDESGTRWEMYLVDDNTMATEDLVIADLDGDGRPDIIAAGRATGNLIIYWNKTQNGSK